MSSENLIILEEKLRRITAVSYRLWKSVINLGKSLNTVWNVHLMFQNSEWADLHVTSFHITIYITTNLLVKLEKVYINLYLYISLHKGSTSKFFPPSRSTRKGPSVRTINGTFHKKYLWNNSTRIYLGPSRFAW